MEHGECIVTVNYTPNHILSMLPHSSSTTTSSKELTLPPILGSIDQGTSSTRYILFDRLGRIVASAQMEHSQLFPEGEDKVGWHEHNPMQIWSNTQTVITKTHEAVQALAREVLTPPSDAGHPLLSQDDSSGVKAIGITNQRETLLAWNANTGLPYGNAIVWDDLRTTKIAQEIAEEIRREEACRYHNGKLPPKDFLREQTGLPLASYFAGTKLRWMVTHIPRLAQDLQHPQRQKNVKFGTIDSWLVYNLTGSKSTVGHPHVANVGGLHVTDVTNASRWLLMDLKTCQWDEELLKVVVGRGGPQVPLSCLPEIKSSSEVYGTCAKGCGIPALENVPIAAILGDQQAALFGQAGFDVGEAKCTYGTGLFLMMNTGPQNPIPSHHGLLTTVAYQLPSPTSSTPITTYALEGSVSHSGSVIQWLRDRLHLLTKASDSELHAKKVHSNEGLYFVPAFAGLFAPHWRSDARGCMVGMTATHGKSHVCRAALEATAYQARDVFEAMVLDAAHAQEHANDSREDDNKEKKVLLEVLKVDGGATANELLMQFQADMIDVPVVAPKVVETTAMGAAYAAGLAVGVWESLEQIQSLWAVDKTWSPTMSSSDRSRYYKGWQKAVTKSFGWIDENGNDGEDDGDGGDKGKLQTQRVQNVNEEEEEGRKRAQRLMVCTLAALVVGFVLGSKKGCHKK